MIDTRGYSCPVPVVMVKNAIKAGNPSELQVILDAECSVENVTRYAVSQGYAVSEEKKGNETVLTLKR